MACKTCDGTGFVTVYDLVDYGSSTIQMPSDEPCPDCLGKGLCPQCGEVVDDEIIEREERCDKCGHKLFEEAL